MSSDDLYGFRAFGVEIEYMIVDRASLEVLPIADRLLRTSSGAVGNEVRRASLAWSNELVRHVIELKPRRPAVRWRGLAQRFQAGVRAANERLAEHGAMLLPSGMHPWMDPRTQTEIWPFGDRELYAQLDRLFNARSHGWANLQSVHLNLPFADEAAFLRLHEALRRLVPLVPALCASSPFREGVFSGWLDSRLEAYRGNASSIPVLTARTVPEYIPSEGAYRRHLLGRIARRLAPLDPGRRLDPLWMNARGIIARLDRNTIEVRVADAQEHPAGDVAVCRLLAATAAWWMERSAADTPPRVSTRDLEQVLQATSQSAERARITPAAYLAGFGWRAAPPCASELWRHLLRCAAPQLARNAALRVILEEGCLARRLLRRLGACPTRGRLRAIYRELAAALATGRPFR